MRTFIYEGERQTENKRFGHNICRAAANLNEKNNDSLNIFYYMPPNRIRTFGHSYTTPGKEV